MYSLHNSRLSQNYNPKITIKQLLLFALIILSFVATNLIAQAFTKITSGPIVNDGGYSRGAGWGYLDNDEYLDLFVVNHAGPEFLYINDQNSGLNKVLTGDIVTTSITSLSTTMGDYDNDGDLDIFIAHGHMDPDPDNSFYSNNGDGTFNKIDVGIVVEDGGYSISCSWGDYNNDGYLDLFVANGANFPPFTGANFLYLNNGDFTFEKIEEGEIVTDKARSHCANWVDYDNDGDLDLYVANGLGGGENNSLYTNNGNSTFSKNTTSIIVSDGGNSQGSSWGDYNNDGFLDLFVANWGSNNCLYKNEEGFFTKMTQADVGEIVTDAKNSIGSSWGDFDNDGDLDLFVANDDNQENLLYSNNGDGTFEKFSDDDISNDFHASYGCYWGDYDRNGFLDLFVANNFINCLYSNNENTNNWINIKCIGTVSNISAIGTKVRLKATINGNTVWQLREISAQTGHGGQNSLNAVFGLSDAQKVEEIVVEWPSGIVQILTNEDSNQFLPIVETNTIVVEIDIKPGSDPNSINLNSKGVIPIAILGNSTFDIITIDQATLEFEGNKAKKKGKSGKIGSFEDVNNDGFDDLVAHFPIPGLELKNHDTEAMLTGTLFDGTQIEGIDDIVIVPRALAKKNVDLFFENTTKVFSLFQNYPNPFNPQTEIRFQLPQHDHVNLSIYNTLGQQIGTLADNDFSEGYHTIQWNGKDEFGNIVSGGLYLCKIQTKNYQGTIRMLFLK